MKILDQLIKTVLPKVQSVNTRIDNIIIGKSFYTMKNSKEIYSDMNLCLVILEDACGFAYFQGELEYDPANIVDKKIEDVIFDPLPTVLKVALTDALYSCSTKKEQKQPLVFKGDLRSKALQRAQRLIEIIPIGAKVLLIGAVSEIIDRAKHKGLVLTVTDLEPSKVGSYSNLIEDGRLTSDKLKNVEYAIVSGMVFVTNTADEIFRIAKENNVKLIFFMESGSNFGHMLIGLGATRVLSEFFPFYDFYGDTKFLIHNKN